MRTNSRFVLTARRPIRSKTSPPRSPNSREEGGAARLKELPGIGAAISQKIIDLLVTGTFKAWEELTAEIPATTLDLLQVEGIGMKTLQLLYSQFQLTSLADFAKFVAGGGLASVPRMTDKAQARIHSSLKQLGY